MVEDLRDQCAQDISLADKPVRHGNSHWMYLPFQVRAISNLSVAGDSDLHRLRVLSGRTKIHNQVSLRACSRTVKKAAMYMLSDPLPLHRACD